MRNLRSRFDSSWARNMITLSTPIEDVPKINKKIIPALKHLGIHKIRDFLFYFPSRYDDFSNLKQICDAKVHETVTIQGTIQNITNRRTARKKMFITESLISDKTGSIMALWFQQPYISRNLKSGDMVSLAGKIGLGPRGLYLQNPAYERIKNYESGIMNNIHTGGLVAVYPETRGITSKWLRFLIKSFIDFGKKVPDPLPNETLKRHDLPDLQNALYSIHFPENLQEARNAEKRFVFENLFLIQLRALKERSLLKKLISPQIPTDLELIKRFVSSLPFQLTNAQKKTIWEILNDIAKPHPMNRLLEGDVGSGKTVVAASAALMCAKTGFQTAFMAPTEILARQHYDTLKKILSPFDINIGLLVGSEKKVSPQDTVIVGTHALIQKKANLKNLGLVVVDEQHRFGVKQRAELLKKQRWDNEKYETAHFLSMSATPIPRTLALTIYGDLDLSILDEMPKSRKEIITRLVERQKKNSAYQFIRDEIKKGRQAFVICPRIEDDLNANLPLNANGLQKKLLTEEITSVKTEYKKLSEEIFPDLKIAMLHGKMKPKEKDEVMRKFKNKETEILVSTSVVEVGVDIPNAAIMAIEGAEKFGLAQLHQFRGRVGRGEHQSYCLLFPSQDGILTRRLKALMKSRNGFELAEKDLEIRGPGNLFGTKQWGISSITLKGITDAKLIREIREETKEVIKKSRNLAQYPALLEKLQEIETETHLE